MRHFRSSSVAKFTWIVYVVTGMVDGGLGPQFDHRDSHQDVTGMMAAEVHLVHTHLHTTEDSVWPPRLEPQNWHDLLHV